MWAVVPLQYMKSITAEASALSHPSSHMYNMLPFHKCMHLKKKMYVLLELFFIHVLLGQVNRNIKTFL